MSLLRVASAARAACVSRSTPRASAVVRPALQIASASRQALRPFSFTPRVLQEATSAEEESKIKADKISSILNAKFQPTSLQIQDVSGGCGAFYAIMVTSEAFKGKSTVQAHRMVNQELKDVIKDIHGLQLKTMAPTS